MIDNEGKSDNEEMSLDVGPSLVERQDAIKGRETEAPTEPKEAKRRKMEEEVCCGGEELNNEEINEEEDVHFGGGELNNEEINEEEDEEDIDVNSMLMKAFDV